MAPKSLAAHFCTVFGGVGGVLWGFRLDHHSGPGSRLGLVHGGHFGGVLRGGEHCGLSPLECSGYRFQRAIAPVAVGFEFTEIRNGLRPVLRGFQVGKLTQTGKKPRPAGADGLKLGSAYEVMICGE